MAREENHKINYSVATNPADNRIDYFHGSSPVSEYILPTVMVKYMLDLN